MSQEILNQFEKDIMIKGFSKRTQDSYVRCVETFLNSFTEPESYSAQNIKDYLFF